MSCTSSSRQNSLAAIIISTPNGLNANHIPVLLDRESGNAHRTRLSRQSDALAMPFPVPKPWLSLQDSITTFRHPGIHPSRNMVEWSRRGTTLLSMPMGR